MTEQEIIDEVYEYQIPEATVKMIEFIAEKLGIVVDTDEMIYKYNRGGYAYAVGKGLCYSVCTSSYADGPDVDMSKEFAKFIRGLDFVEEGSAGDNGMDSATNWHDTYWHYRFLYKPSERELW